MTETNEEKRPCGEHHPLPCGLDAVCPVPVGYFVVHDDDETAVERWRAEEADDD